MALDFPDAPTDGQGYEGFSFDATAGAWRVRGELDNFWCSITETPTGSYNDGVYDWNYWIYKTDGTLTVTTTGRADYLVVAGGGSGATSNSHDNVGGGGAGGVIQSTEFARLAAGTYAVTIGVGGATNSGTERAGNDGSNSSLGAGLVAIGGGAGQYRNVGGNPGGCGGGSGDLHVLNNSSFGGAPTFGQGFSGGGGGQLRGAGGGGAGGPGENGTAAVPIGGVGRITTIVSTTIATAQSIGEVDGGNVYFGGGGGCGSDVAGGLGGGGDGSPLNGRGVDCPPNTGGGSGSSDSNLGAPYAGVGGSGVVIVRTRA